MVFFCDSLAKKVRTQHCFILELVQKQDLIITDVKVNSVAQKSQKREVVENKKVQISIVNLNSRNGLAM